MDTYSIVSGVEDPQNLFSNQSGGRNKRKASRKTSKKRSRKPLRKTSKKRSRKTSKKRSRKTAKKRSRKPSRKTAKKRSRSRSLSRGNCKTSHKIAPGTCGYPTLAQVDQYSDDGEDIKKTIRGVTRYLEFDSTSGKYYWVKTNTGKKRKSNKLGSSLTSKGQQKGDFMAMYMWMKKQRAQREAAQMPARGELSDAEWNAYKGAFDTEFNPASFITSNAIGACVHSTSFQGEDNFTEQPYAKHTFVWKGDVKVQEDQEIQETCQNIMFFGVVDNQEDLWRYSSEPGYANLFGREVCNALYNASGPSSTSASANHAAVQAVLSKAEYNPTGAVSLVVLQKTTASQNGYPKVTAYKFSKGPGANMAQPRFFTIESGATRDKMTEVTSNHVTLPDDNPANSQLHIVLGNSTFMTNTQQGFIDWLFGAGDTTSITATNVSPQTCQALAQSIARKNPAKTVTCLYAVLDEAGVNNAVNVFTPSATASAPASASTGAPAPPPPPPAPTAFTSAPGTSGPPPGLLAQIQAQNQGSAPAPTSGPALSQAPAPTSGPALSQAPAPTSGPALSQAASPADVSGEDDLLAQLQANLQQAEGELE